MKKKLILSIVLIVLAFTAITSLARRRAMSIPEVTLQTCGGTYILANYDGPDPIPFGQLDVRDATGQWTGEGCTEIVFKPAGDGNFFGYGVKIGFAE